MYIINYLSNINIRKRIIYYQFIQLSNITRTRFRNFSSIFIAKYSNTKKFVMKRMFVYHY